MNIIRANEKHVEIVGSLFNDYRIFYEQATAIDQAIAFIKARIAANESIIFLATDETESIGMGFVQLYPSFTSVGLARIFVLNDLYVHPSYRQKGVARKLLEAAREFAEQNHAKKLVLQTAISNTKAQKLYESLGYCKEQKFLSYTLFL